MEELALRNKFEKLIGQLLVRTKKGSLEWSDTSDPEAFRANLIGGMIRVQRELRQDPDEGVQRHVYSLTLLDRAGRELDEYYAEAEKLEDLWSIARRSARKIESVLNEMLSETGAE